MKTLIRLAFFLALSVPCFSATEYFVSPTGVSGNSGLTTNLPKNLQAGLNLLNPGITVTLLSGTYTGAGYFAIDGTGGNNSGTPTNPAIIRAQHRWEAVIANSTNQGFVVFFCTNVIIDGLCISNSVKEGLKMTGQSNVVQNCWITDNGEIGYSASDPNNANHILEDCLIELSGHGVWDGTNGHRWHGTYLVGPNLIVRNNVCRNNAGQGLAFGVSFGAFMNNLHMYNNLTYGHDDFDGMQVRGAEMESDPPGLNPGTNFVYGNTIMDGIDVGNGTLYMSNNIIMTGPHSPTYPVKIYDIDPLNLIMDYNFTTAASFWNPARTNAEVIVTHGVNNVINSDVGLVSTNTGLFWLKATSPVRNEAATTIFHPTNFFGQARSSVLDIGAFQYSSIYAADTRDLTEGSEEDYWEILSGPSTNRILRAGIMSVGSIVVP